MRKFINEWLKIRVETEFLTTEFSAHDLTIISILVQNSLISFYIMAGIKGNYLVINSRVAVGWLLLDIDLLTKMPFVAVKLKKVKNSA